MKKFTNKVSSDITKVTQAYNSSQEKTGQLIENTLSQALTKAQNIITAATPIDTRNFGTNCTNHPHKARWTSTWPSYNYNMSQQPEINRHQVYRPYKYHIPHQTHTNQQYPHQASRHQSVCCWISSKTELTHRIQHLHQQTTDALNIITRSSSHQENLQLINYIPVFKAKDLQSFDDWLEQIDKVTSLTNKDPYRLGLAKSQGSFSRTISSYPPTLGWNQIKEKNMLQFQLYSY